MNKKGMSDSELLAIVNDAERSAVQYNGEFMDVNNKLYEYYMGEPFGDEVEGQSQVVSTDVADVVESDMPSLIRVFCGGGERLKFIPCTNEDIDITEAEEKTRFCDWVINNQDNSFKIQHDWIKASEIQQCSILAYGLDESKKTEVKRYDGLNELEVVERLESMRSNPNVSKVDIIGQDENEDGTFYLEIRLTKETKRIKLWNIPPEEFIISQNATCKDSAEVIGTKSRKTRSQLIQDGYDKKLVKSLPSFETADNTEARADRFKQQGGDTTTKVKHWASEEVEVSDLYVLVDYDDDGIAERRHIVKAGEKILENEAFDHVPFAILSSILMPHRLIGRARAEQVTDTQRTQSVLLRQTLDNIYGVNSPRNIVDENTIDMDDMLTIRYNGIVRNDGQVGGSVMPLTIPYIGDKSLQVIQYVDSKRAQTTGSLMANQGLNPDAISKETATRFNGTVDAGRAKIELIARNIAETGYKQLYNGIVWFASHYLDKEQQVIAIGKELTINPSKWINDHKLESMIGLGAGDNDKIMDNMSGLLQIMSQLTEKGSVLVDEKKVYNVLSKLIRSMGIYRVNEFLNDPEIPVDLLMAQNALLEAQVKTMEQPNPLAEAEQVKAEAAIKIKQADHQLKLIEMSQKQQVDMQQFRDELTAKFTELELKYGADVPGSLV